MRADPLPLLRAAAVSVQGGWTALMSAAAHGQEAVVQLLLTAGADKDARNNVSGRAHVVRARPLACSSC